MNIKIIFVPLFGTFFFIYLGLITNIGSMQEIRMRAIPESLHKQIRDILDFECKTAPEFIRPILNDILKEYSEDVKNATKLQAKKSIRLRGVSPTKYNQLKNISNYLGITIEQLIRLRLQKIADEYPIQFP